MNLESENQHCQSCGLPMDNDKRNTKNEEVRYCSKKCSSQKLNKKDRSLENFLVESLDRGKNYCPSQFSRKHFGDNWKENHQRVVKACRRLCLKGQIEILQNGQRVKSMRFKGPIRIAAIR